MADKRHKVTISFRKEQEHVWELLLEHFANSGDTNRSAAIIALLDRALSATSPDSESQPSLYELERLSLQVEEVHQRVGELTRIVLARDEHSEVDEWTNHSQRKFSQPNGQAIQSHVDEVAFSGREIPEHAFGQSGSETGEDRQAAAQGNDTTVSQEPTHDGTVSESKTAPQRTRSRWDATRERWVPCKQHRRL